MIFVFRGIADIILLIVVREIYKEQYGAQTEIFYVGYLIKNIIEKYDIKCFKYEMLLEKMIRVDPAERMVSFEKIQNSIAEQTFEQVKFSYKKKRFIRILQVHFVIH